MARIRITLEDDDGREIKGYPYNRCQSRQRQLAFRENRQKPPQHKQFPHILDVFGIFGRGDRLITSSSRYLLSLRSR
jgi:hypothetical protein